MVAKRNSKKLRPSKISDPDTLFRSLASSIASAAQVQCLESMSFLNSCCDYEMIVQFRWPLENSPGISSILSSFGKICRESFEL